MAFESRAANLSTVDGDPTRDVFVRDLVADTTTLVSRAPDGSPADGDSGDPALSAKAAMVVFESQATNLSDTDLDATTDVFVHDVAAGTTTLVSRHCNRVPVPTTPRSIPRSRMTGRRVAFASEADNLSAIDNDGVSNVYLSQQLGSFRVLTHLSRDSTSGSVDHPADGDSLEPVISATGGHVAFSSWAGNLTEDGIATPSVVGRLRARGVCEEDDAGESGGRC